MVKFLILTWVVRSEWHKSYNSDSGGLSDIIPNSDLGGLSDIIPNSDLGGLSDIIPKYKYYKVDHLHVWYDFLDLQEMWILNPFGEANQ